MLACVDLLHLAELRRAPEREAEIYATPGTAYLRRRLARQRPAALKTVVEAAMAPNARKEFELCCLGTGCTRCVRRNPGSQGARRLDKLGAAGPSYL